MVIYFAMECILNLFSRITGVKFSPVVTTVLRERLRSFSSIILIIACSYPRFHYFSQQLGVYPGPHVEQPYLFSEQSS